jgi:EAL domain-containing protein (putative c-di-GMP-specific phosphodiesterase class I)
MTRIPVNYLKVHGILTETVEDNPDVMKGLISIAHGLGMEVVAEQVETLEEARVLMQANCDYLQGFLFSKPVVAHEAEQMFEMDYAPILGLEKREKEGSV